MAKGVTGDVQFMRLFGGPEPDFVIRDVVRAAEITVHDPDNGTVRFAKHQPFNTSIVFDEAA